ncbi:hypothetical protein OsJ_23785 [Oryza sativa Japonica Group]|uniref:Uncharacterized protein n=1 Tax=Oryza sativa subsp. japonica TaxID=39947 RepID=B9FWJ0_ORYSJ|nr:hypothetical protein OsJ_23785 [Oryza sativa Japonica Group]
MDCLVASHLNGNPDSLDDQLRFVAAAADASVAYGLAYNSTVTTRLLARANGGTISSDDNVWSFVQLTALPPPSAPVFPSHIATGASRTWAPAATAFDLRDGVVDGNAEWSDGGSVVMRRSPIIFFLLAIGERLQSISHPSVKVSA